MKNENKNMLLGFFMGKSQSEDELNIPQTLITVCLSPILAYILTILYSVYIKGIPEDKFFPFIIFAFFLSLFIIAQLFRRLPRFMYLLIFAPPLIYFLNWLFFVP